MEPSTDRSDGRLVYYSLAMLPGSASAAEAARQLVQSVRSLRRHNDRIRVVVLAFGALPDGALRALRDLRAEVEERESYAEHLATVCPPRMVEALCLLPLLQKWTGLRHLPEPHPESVLYVDTDTVFLGDVERLFDTFSDHDLYAREEPFTRTSHLGYHPEHIDQRALDQLAFREDSRAPEPFNCGVVLMNRGSWRRIAEASPELARLAYRLALGFASLPPDPRQGRDVELLRARPRAEEASGDVPILPPTADGWQKEQLALWLVTGKLAGLSVGTFPTSSVLQGREYTLFDPAALGTVVVHYFSNNTSHLREAHPEWLAGESAERAPSTRAGAGDPEAFFRALGERIEAAFLEAGHDEARFPEIAERALRDARPADHLRDTSVLEWLMRARSIPRQINIAYDFGQPAVVVYSAPLWYIEVIHWLDGTTNIHQHGFNGAFSVLAGSSLHTRYSFEPKARYGARLLRGDLARTGAELLRAGDVRRIDAGAGLIHSLFHLERPSVTVVVRTDHVPGDTPQYTFEEPGLAFDPFHQPELLVRRRQAIEALAAFAPRKLARTLPETLGSVDPFTLVSLSLAAAPLVGESELRRALVPAREKAGDLVDTILEVAHRRRRRARLIALRSRLRSADHRFFLALLLSFDTVSDMRSVVRARHPESDPDDLLIQWLSEVTSAPDPEDPSRPVFAVTIAGALSDLARAMLGGATFESTIARLGQSYDPADLASQAADLRRAYDALRGAELITPLFRGAAPD